MARKPFPGERPADWDPASESNSGEGSAIAEAAPKKMNGCLKATIIGTAILFGLAVLGAILGDPPADDVAVAEAGVIPGGDEAADGADGEVAVADEIADDRKISAAQLSGAYSENEVAAQRWANAGPVEVTGTIEAIELDFMDEPVVQLRGHEMFATVSVYFGKADSNVASTLRKGQSLTVRCAEISEIMGFPQLNDCVMM